MQLHTVFQMPSESHEDEEMSVAEDIHWDETMEMALCYAAIKFKPVGKIHDCFQKRQNRQDQLSAQWTTMVMQCVF